MDGVVSGCTHPRAASLLTGQNKSHHLTPTLEAIIEQPRPRLPEQPPCACAPSKEAVANGPEVLHFNITAASSQHHQCIRSTSPQHHQIRFSIYKCKPSVRRKFPHQKRDFHTDKDSSKLCVGAYRAELHRPRFREANSSQDSQQDDGTCLWR